MNISQVLEATKMIEVNDTKSKELTAYFLVVLISRHASNKLLKKRKIS